jgi:hypothetical protein
VKIIESPVACLCDLQYDRDVPKLIDSLVLAPLRDMGIKVESVPVAKVPFAPSADTFTKITGEMISSLNEKLRHQGVSIEQISMPGSYLISFRTKLP